MSPSAVDAVHIDKCMNYDDVAWERSDNVFETWKVTLYQENVLREIGRLIDQWRGGLPEELFAPKRGAFNAWLRMKFKDGGSAIIRFPCPGASMFPEEKVRREVSVMRFLERHTSIPVPHVLHYGMTEESPGGLGPFIIMEYIDNAVNLIDVLEKPGLSPDDRAVLDPNISKETLEWTYSQMADIMLQLSKHSFAQIGCIAKAKEDDDFDDQWIVKHRPLTFNMNELVQLGNFPPHLLPQHAFQTSSSYYQALAEMHMNHLSTQRNDAIESAGDCRRKYIARCLFRKLAREHRLCRQDSGSFRLFCDDFRPGNVLANAELHVVGAVDWEFSYAAPVGFAYSPPFWLLLELPEFWPEGLQDWAQHYEKRLETFLGVLKQREDVAINRGILTEEHRLSNHMRESWESGDFWVNYAARKSWAFDMVYWAKIDKRFFGDGDLEDRLQLLTEEERDHMDGFIWRKLVEKKERTLTDWSDIEATRIATGRT